MSLWAKGSSKNRNRVLIAVLGIVVLSLSACAGVTAIPSPMADVPPEPQPQILSCGLMADGAAFTLDCAEPTATPEATATPEPTVTPEATAIPEPTATPAFWYFWCTGDPRCSSGQFRVYWDRDLTMLRCALPVGDKVDLITYGLSGRVPEESEELAWVVTGADAGGKACEGWTPLVFLRAAE